MKRFHPLASLAIAFSRYSRIPMPQFVWSEEDFGASLAFFPGVGLVIALLAVSLNGFLTRVQAPVFVQTCFLICLPLAVTGGFHVDGYMDTADARSSYGDREKKLAILHDPRAGAFAVIGLLRMGLFYAGSLYLLLAKGRGFYSEGWIAAWSAGFVVARALAGLGVCLLPVARQEGMLYEEARSTRHYPGAIRGSLALTVAAALGAAVYWDRLAGMVMIGACAASLGYFLRVCRREFGGITGDLAGYFVVICEVNMTVGLAAVPLMGAF